MKEMIYRSSMIWKQNIMKNEEDADFEDIECFYQRLELDNFEKGMNELMLHTKYGLYSKEARKSWEEIFIRGEIIKKQKDWLIFWLRFRKIVNAEDRDERILQYLFMDDKQQVPLAKFSKSLSYFGKIDLNWAEKVRTLFMSGWFFGYYQVESYLRNDNVAVGFPEFDQPSILVLCHRDKEMYKKNQKIFKYKIHHSYSSDLYVFGSKKFDSLVKLIEYFCLAKKISKCSSNSPLKDLAKEYVHSGCYISCNFDDSDD